MFNWQDPLLFIKDLSTEELLIKQTTEKYAQTKLLPRIISDNRNDYFDKSIYTELGNLGLIGSTLHDYGNVSHNSYGLIAFEIEKIDSSYRSALSVQSSLVMHPIDQYGSKTAKEKYLDKLASGELIGCFGLTEPNHGSDPSSMETTAKKTDNGYIINGSKNWITNANIADIFIIWAKLDGKIKGFIAERSDLIETRKISGKYSLRASDTGIIYFNDCYIPNENILDVEGLKGPFSCLNKARFGISFGALGAAWSCYEIARNYCIDRKQFNKPLAQNQLIQKKLSEMAIELSISMQACLKVGKLLDENQASNEMISIVKKNSTTKALEIARKARDMLGGNGISDEYHIIRHMNNLEAVHTYEGTADIHDLIIARAITGLSSF